MSYQTSNPLPLSLDTCTSLELQSTYSVFRPTFVKTTRDPDTKFFVAIRTQFPKSMPVIRKSLLALVAPKPKKSSGSRLLQQRKRSRSRLIQAALALRGRLTSRRRCCTPLHVGACHVGACGTCAFGSVESRLFYTVVNLIIHEVFVVYCINDARPARECATAVGAWAWSS